VKHFFESETREYSQSHKEEYTPDHQLQDVGGNPDSYESACGASDYAGHY